MATERRTRNNIVGNRIRSAACVVLFRSQRPMGLDELADGIEALGIPLGPSRNKTLADALRWEIARGRIRRWGRATYRAGSIPRTTLNSMRQRVASYAAGETTYEQIRRRLSESDASSATARLAAGRDPVLGLIDSIMASAPPATHSPRCDDV
jgi:hypothetical protein